MSILDEANRRLDEEEAAARRFDPLPEPPLEAYSDDPVLEGGGTNHEQSEPDAKTKRDGATHTESTPRLRLIPAADLLTEPALPRWLIKNALETDTLIVSFGDSGAGKSFVALDWACSVVTGTQWHGHPVKQGPVIYLAGEGNYGLRRRLKAWQIARQVQLAGAPLYVSNCAPMLPTDFVQLRAAIDGAVKALGRNPIMIVIDTLARCLDGDENSTRDMGAFVATLDNLRRDYGGPAILVVHHTGHSDKNRGRGAYALHCATDFEYRVERSEKLVSVIPKKFKDHELPEPMRFELRTVDLPWTDEDGQSLTSAVLVPTDKRPEPAEEQNKSAPLGQNQKQALTTLKKLNQAHRDNLIKGGQDSAGARVQIKDWREACGLNRQRFLEVKIALEQRGFIVVEEPYVRLSETSETSETSESDTSDTPVPARKTSETSESPFRDSDVSDGGADPTGSGSEAKSDAGRHHSGKQRPPKSEAEAEAPEYVV